MLIPHLHLGGKCREALSLYERAFQTTTDFLEYVSDDEPEKGVMHAEMHIHGQRVMLNDKWGNTALSPDSALQLVVIFDTVEALKSAYAFLQESSVTLVPMHETPYSPCVVGFLDRFGVHWGFMCS